MPADLALQGFDGVRAFAADPDRSREFLEQTLEFARRKGDNWEARGERRGGFEESQSTFSSRGDARGGFARTKRGPMVIEGELVAKSTGTVSEFTLDDRVFHQKFGYGNVVKIDGNKLTIAFEKAGEKKVVDSFVERV